MVEPPCGRPRAGEVGDEGADQAALVDALVLVEALVFRCDERVTDRLGDIGERDPDAALALLEHFRKAVSLAVEHDARARQLEPAQLVVVGQVGGGLVVDVDHLAEIDGGFGNLLVLAELPIGRLQIGKVDAAKHLDLVGDGLRVVDRGGDEVVEIDVLDVEGFAHVGAAGLQQAGDLRLVSRSIELGRDGARRDGDLTERQRGREHLDEERFHAAGRPEAVAARAQV